MIITTPTIYVKSISMQPNMSSAEFVSENFQYNVQSM